MGAEPLPGDPLLGVPLVPHPQFDAPVEQFVGCPRIPIETSPGLGGVVGPFAGIMGSILYGEARRRHITQNDFYDRNQNSCIKSIDFYRRLEPNTCQ